MGEGAERSEADKGKCSALRMLESTATKRLPLGGEAVRLVLTDEARNPPLPVADTGGCSANEATSFASASVAKRLCRIVRAVAAAAALSAILVIITATS